MKSDGTISSVVEDNLCTGCGTCVALCPNEAIEMVIDEKKGIYVPELDERKCNNCGICFKVCPGHEVDFKALNLEIFGKDPDDILIGNYLNCYVGHATDYDIRYNSASGGLVTQLLTFALEEGMIDGVLVTRMKKDNPLEPEPFIARRKEEILEASRSKYCPVPANIALKGILEAKEGEKFAVVGLPCHIHGIRKAEQINKKLREKIVLHFGIMCSHTLDFMATEFLFSKSLGIEKSDVKKFNYRGNGWPGTLSIELEDGNKIYYPFPKFGRLHLLHFFAHKRCLVCGDQNCELADISFGDAWLPEFKNNDNIGTSVISIRTERGKKLLQHATLKKKVDLSEITRDKLVQSQKDVIRFKKKTINANRSIFKKNPTYNLELLKPEAADYLMAALFHVHMYLSSKRYLWRFITSVLLFEWGLAKILVKIKHKIL
ncbi:MAG: Coenzyme F420 hydrogenase/dehydrogenase, beta subunit C-terminal domain [Candidatus Njordarchaeales archaeon]